MAMKPAASSLIRRSCANERKKLVEIRGLTKEFAAGSSTWSKRKHVVHAVSGVDLDYETVGELMYQTHFGLSRLYEVSCEELDFLNRIARRCEVTGSRVMGGGFGGCTVNLVRDELYDGFISTVKSAYSEKYGREPRILDVVTGDGAREL